jgi:protein MpaA
MLQRRSIELAIFVLLACLTGARADAPAVTAAPSPASAESGRGARWCGDLAATGRTLGWKFDACDGVNWHEGGVSVEGRSLMYADFGDPTAQNVTLVFSEVHGDEVTPLYLAIQLALWLRDPAHRSGGTRVVIAPLVNPDGFFRKPRVRMNAHGVDLNRNLATRDWDKFAMNAWKKRFRSDPRRFPGTHPVSEPETLFQQELIRQVKPQKILSIHAPLNFMDYDGPTVLSLARFPREYVRECLALRSKLKAVSSGFFPGSLGNYAGRELGIPTLTLELPTADAKRAERYWRQFSKGIRTMIEFTVPTYVSTRL